MSKSWPLGALNCILTAYQNSADQLHSIPNGWGDQLPAPMTDLEPLVEQEISEATSPDVEGGSIDQSSMVDTLPTVSAVQMITSNPEFLKAVKLRSAFQFIFSLAHASPVGQEALLRSLGPHGAISASETLRMLAEQMSISEIEETCARLHLNNFATQKREGWLFLNLSPEVLPDRSSVLNRFGGWLEETGVQGHQVVIEIVEKRARSEASLAGAIEGFRDLGCLVAIDDFGAGESNFERIWRIGPDIVKLDRAMLTEACENPRVRQLLPGIVSLLHEAGCLVVFEGIETPEQALIALESDIDFVQGYLFSRPSEEKHEAREVAETFADLGSRFRVDVAKRAKQDDSFFQFYRGAFQQCARSLESHAELHLAADGFMNLPGVQRVYLLDSDGRQVGENLERRAQGERGLSRFDPFIRCQGADWFRRPYFQRAIGRPSVLQISRPYLSVRDATRCVTLSIGFKMRSKLHVLCADLDYENPNGNPGRRRRIAR